MIRAARLAAVTVLLTACAGQVRPPVSADPQQAWQHHRQQLAGLVDWDLDGRVSVRQGREGGSGGLHWRQRALESTLHGSGPLGRGAFRLYVGPQGGRLELGDGRFLEDADTAQLLGVALGVQVPVAELRFWTTGQPAPGHPAQIRLDAAGRLAQLEQAGWHIEYLAYTPAGPRLPVALPAKLRASSGEIELRLTVRSWDVPATAATHP